MGNARPDPDSAVTLTVLTVLRLDPDGAVGDPVGAVGALRLDVAPSR